jgi:acyl dehydratase
MLLTFKDFAAGQVYKSGPYVVSKDDIGAFCDVLGHSSEMLSFAEQAMFNQWLASSLAMRLIASGEIQVSGGTVGLGIDSLEWGVPIQPDDTLVIDSQVLEVSRVSFEYQLWNCDDAFNDKKSMWRNYSNLHA